MLHVDGKKNNKEIRQIEEKGIEVLFEIGQSSFDKVTFEQRSDNAKRISQYAISIQSEEPPKTKGRQISVKVPGGVKNESVGVDGM